MPSGVVPPAVGWRPALVYFALCFEGCIIAGRFLCHDWRRVTVVARVCLVSFLFAFVGSFRILDIWLLRRKSR